MVKIKRLALAFAVFFTLSGIFGACASKKEAPDNTAATTTTTTAANNTATTATVDQTTAKPSEIKVALTPDHLGRTNDTALIDEVKKYLEEKTNTKIDLQVIPQNTYLDKLNVLLTSGEVVDVMLVQQAQLKVPQFATRDYLLALDDYMKTSPNLSKLDGKLLEPFISNGKLYAIPVIKPQVQVILARKDIFDKYGVKAATTTDEFYNEMKKLVPTGIVPLSFPKWVNGFQFFYNSFGAWYGIGQDKDGKWVDGFNTPEMKEALLYLQKLYKDGILDKEFITNENSTMREKQWAGKAASSVYWGSNLMSYQIESKKQDPNAENIIIPELKGPRGNGGCLNVGISDVLAASAKSKSPDAAVRFIDWFGASKEGLVTKNLGVKDKHYEVGADGIAKPIEAATKAGYKFETSMLINIIPKGDLGFKLEPESQKYLDKNIEALDSIMKVLGPRYNVPSGKSDIYDKTISSYIQKIDELSAKIIMGSGTLESVYKEYESFWKSFNGDKMLEELNKK